RIGDLRDSRKLRTISLRGASVVLNDEILSALAPPAPAQPLPGDPDSPPEPVESAPFDLNRLAFFTDAFSVRDSHLTVDLDGLPRIEADWNVRTGGLEFDDSGLNHEMIDLRLNDVLVGEGGGNGRIERLIASARVRRDLSQVHLGSLHLFNPRLRITPDLFPSSVAESATQQDQVTGSTGSASTGTSSPKSLPGLIVAAFRVDGGTVEIRGF